MSVPEHEADIDFSRHDVSNEAQDDLGAAATLLRVPTDQSCCVCCGSKGPMGTEHRLVRLLLKDGAYALLKTKEKAHVV